MTDQTGAALVQDARHILLDFDGPVCDIFAGLPAPTVAANLRSMLEETGTQLPAYLKEEDDPLEIFRFSAGLDQELNQIALEALTRLEMEAVGTARPAPGASEFIRWARDTNRPLAVTSNNSAVAVTKYLRKHGLLADVMCVSARTDPDPGLLKPNPHLVWQALKMLSATAPHAVMIGDSVADVDAAKLTQVRIVGYANRPGKAERLSAAGADAIVTAMAELIG